MIEPVIHRIVIKPDTLEDIDPMYRKAQAAGISIPEMAEAKMERNGVDRGVVMAIGPTAFKDFGAVDVVQVGDYIAYARYAGKKIKDVDEVEYLVINDEDVVCKLTKVEA